MRWLTRWPPAALALLAAMASSALAAPERVVSLNLCADELVLRLLPPERIASVTWLSQRPESSTVAALAAAVPANHGLAEEAMRFDPDLIVAGIHTTRAAVAFLRRIGRPVIDLEVPATLDEVREQISTLATALAVPERGQALIEEMDGRFAALKPPPEAARPKAIVLNPNGFTVGRGSLVDAMLSRAGLDNLAAELGLESYGQIPLETVILAGADMLIVDAEPDRPPALATELLRHPALLRLGRRIAIAAVPSRFWTCGGPRLAEAVAILAEARAALARPVPPA